MAYAAVFYLKLNAAKLVGQILAQWNICVNENNGHENNGHNCETRTS